MFLFYFECYQEQTHSHQPATLHIGMERALGMGNLMDKGYNLLKIIPNKQMDIMSRYDLFINMNTCNNIVLK